MVGFERFNFVRAALAALVFLHAASIAEAFLASSVCSQMRTMRCRPICTMCARATQESDPNTNLQVSSENAMLSKENSRQQKCNIKTSTRDMPAVSRRLVVSLGFLPLLLGPGEISTCIAPDITTDGTDESSLRQEYNRQCIEAASQNLDYNWLTCRQSQVCRIL
jgi:hypothetical protein